MLFPSEVFLFVFLPVVLGVYYLLLRKTKHLKNIFLLAASLFFYAWGEPQNVWLMVGVILFNWFFGILVDKVRDHKVPVRILMTVMVLTNVGILGWYKYSEFVMLQVNRFLHTEFTVPDVTLPIGISFFTFQAMSYVIDVYRGHGKVQKNPLQVGLYSEWVSGRRQYSLGQTAEIIIKGDDDYERLLRKHMETQGTCSAGTSGIPDIAFYHVCAYGWSCDGI